MVLKNQLIKYYTFLSSSSSFWEKLFFFRILKELVAETEMEVERQQKREPPLPFRGAAGGGTVFIGFFFVLSPEVFPTSVIHLLLEHTLWETESSQNRSEKKLSYLVIFEGFFSCTKIFVSPYIH